MPIKKLPLLSGKIKPVPKLKPKAVPAWMKPAVPNVTQTTPNMPNPATGTVLGTLPTPRSAVPSNYQATLAQITGSPLGEMAKGQYNTDMQSLMRALRSGLGQGIVQSGYDPTAAFQKLMADRPDLGEFADLIDPTAIATANQNPLSEKALTEKAYGQGMSNLDYELAARGIEGSGAQATGGNQILQQRQLAENQSRQNLLNALQSGITGYLGQKTQGYNQLQDTYARVAEMLAAQEGGLAPEGDEDLADVNAGQGMESMVPGSNVPSAATPPANYVMWGGKPMQNMAQMKQWLAAHGQNWNTWANQHVDAARRLYQLSR